MMGLQRPAATALLLIAAPTLPLIAILFEFVDVGKLHIMVGGGESCETSDGVEEEMPLSPLLQSVLPMPMLPRPTLAALLTLTPTPTATPTIPPLWQCCGDDVEVVVSIVMVFDVDKTTGGASVAALCLCLLFLFLFWASTAGCLACVCHFVFNLLKFF